MFLAAGITLFALGALFAVCLGRAASIGDEQIEHARMDHALTGGEVVQLRAVDPDERLAEIFAGERRSAMHLVKGGDEPGLGGAA